MDLLDESAHRTRGDSPVRVRLYLLRPGVVGVRVDLAEGSHAVGWISGGIDWRYGKGDGGLVAVFCSEAGAGGFKSARALGIQARPLTRSGSAPPLRLPSKTGMTSLCAAVEHHTFRTLFLTPNSALRKRSSRFGHVPPRSPETFDRPLSRPKTAQKWSRRDLLPRPGPMGL